MHREPHIMRVGGRKGKRAEDKGRHLGAQEWRKVVCQMIRTDVQQLNISLPNREVIKIYLW